MKVLAIIGSTASGKSDLALKLAQKFNGEIISCDSVQIYKYFNIGSAKPSKQQLSSVTHYLIDSLEPNISCSAGYWKKQAISYVNKIIEKNKLPIIVGGTGLYLKSLYCGMFEENSRDQEYREYLQNKCQNQGVDVLFKELQKQDSIYADKIACTDSLRIIRALEAMYVTNIKFSELHTKNIKPDWEWVFTQPNLSKEDINHRIALRIDLMLKEGLIEETKELLNRFGKTAIPIDSIGYRHIVEFLDNKKNFTEMKNTLIQDTRKFGKRQRTLFRSLIPQECILDPETLLKGDHI